MPSAAIPRQLISTLALEFRSIPKADTTKPCGHFPGPPNCGPMTPVPTRSSQQPSTFQSILTPWQRNCSGASQRRIHRIQARYDYGLCLWKDYEASREPSLLGPVESEFKAATALDPHFAGAHFRLGLLFDEKAMPGAAIREYQQAIHFSPDLAAAHYRLAQDYLRSGRKQEAEAEMEIYEGLHHHR